MVTFDSAYQEVSIDMQYITVVLLEPEFLQEAFFPCFPEIPEQGVTESTRDGQNSIQFITHSP